MSIPSRRTYCSETEALLSAVPVPDPYTVLQPVRPAGAVPSAAGPPRGLWKADLICEAQAPPTETTASGHSVGYHIPLATLTVVQGQGGPLYQK